MSKVEQLTKETIVPYEPQAVVNATYDLLNKEAHNASYYEYSIEKLSAGKFGIVECGEKKERMFVMLSDRFYTQFPCSIGWAYELGDHATFSFDIQTGVRHETCRVVSIENITSEIASLRYKCFLETFTLGAPKKTIRDNLFIDGIWFAVQHIIIVRDMPKVAAEIIKKADLSFEVCKTAQERSGLYDKEMMEFIKNELAYN